MTIVEEFQRRVGPWWPLLIFIGGQAVAIFLWGVNLNGKVADNTHSVEELLKHVEILDSVGGRQVHRTVARIEALERLTDRMDVLNRTMPQIDERTQTLRNYLNTYAERNNEQRRAYKLQSNDGKEEYILGEPENPLPKIPEFNKLAIEE